VDLTGYSNILLPHHLNEMEEAANGLGVVPADVDYEAAQFTQSAGGKYDTSNGYTVRQTSARKVAERVRSVVGNQEGATALVIHEGDTFDSVVANMDAQLGTRWHRSGGKALLANDLAGAQSGDIVDVSKFYRAAYNDTLRANYSELQDFAQEQRSTAADTGFTETPDVHINAVSASAAAAVQLTWRLANDASAPPFMQREARQAFTEGVAFAVAPFGVIGRAKSLGRARAGVGVPDKVGLTAAEEAAAWQGSPRFPGVDRWRDILLGKERSFMRANLA